MFLSVQDQTRRPKHSKGNTIPISQPTTSHSAISPTNSRHCHRAIQSSPVPNHNRQGHETRSNQGNQIMDQEATRAHQALQSRQAKLLQPTNSTPHNQPRCIHNTLPRHPDGSLTIRAGHSYQTTSQPATSTATTNAARIQCQVLL